METGIAESILNSHGADRLTVLERFHDAVEYIVCGRPIVVWAIRASDAPLDGAEEL